MLTCITTLQAFCQSGGPQSERWLLAAARTAADLPAQPRFAIPCSGGSTGLCGVAVAVSAAISQRSANEECRRYRARGDVPV